MASPCFGLCRIGFKGYTERVEGFIAAKSYLLKNAFEGEGADLVINPALVKVSYGDLPLPQNITASLLSAGQIQFTWNAEGTGDRFDQAMLLAYDIENAKVYSQITGQFRNTGADILDISPTKERTYHLYLAFVAADRSRQSDSVYLGTISN